MKEIKKTESAEKIELAKEFATKKFETVGVGNHFLEVEQILREEFHVEDEGVLVAGLLHDTLEDTDTTVEEIEKTFSKRVADMVVEVSHPKNYNAQEKVEYYERLKHVSPGAKMIKLADFTSHLKKYIGAFTGMARSYPKSTTNGYVVLVQSFLESCPDSVAKNSAFVLTKELDSYIKNGK